MLQILMRAHMNDRNNDRKKRIREYARKLQLVEAARINSTIAIDLPVIV